MLPSREHHPSFLCRLPPLGDRPPPAPRRGSWAGPLGRSPPGRPAVFPSPPGVTSFPGVDTEPGGSLDDGHVTAAALRPRGRRTRRRGGGIVPATVAPGGYRRGTRGRPARSCGLGRHRARGDPDAGEPFLRSLLRHPARSARLRRPERDRTPLRQDGLRTAGTGGFRRPSVPGARGGGSAEEGPPVHRRPRPLVERRRQGLVRRLDGRLGHREDRRDHGVLRPRRHPAAPRTRRHLHGLRRLPLLDPQLHQPEPQPPVERQNGRRGRRQAGRGQRRVRRGHPPGIRLGHVRREAGEGRAELEDLHRVGELHRQPDRVLRHLQGRRPQGAGQDRRAHVHGVLLRHRAGRGRGGGAGAAARPARRGRRRTDPCGAQPVRAGAAPGPDGHAGRRVRPGRGGRNPARGLLPGSLRGGLRAPERLLAGAQRDDRLQDPGRPRQAPRRMASHRRPHQLRRERRLLRPRAAAGRPSRGDRGALGGPAHRTGGTGAPAGRLPLVGRRIRLLRGLRPHLRDPSPGALDGGGGTQHRRLAAPGHR
ncbi:hypothetical protein OKW18_002118 [Streptomyces pratensis]|nr:hypothetical protein [Streptomyces pratensis]